MSKKLKVITAERKLILKGNLVVQVKGELYDIYYNRDNCTGIYKFINGKYEELDHCRVKELTGYSIKGLKEKMEKEELWDRDDLWDFNYKVEELNKEIKKLKVENERLKEENRKLEVHSHYLKSSKPKYVIGQSIDDEDIPF